MSDILSQLKACVSEPWTRVCDADIFDAIDEIDGLRAELAAAIKQRDGYLEGNRQTLRALQEANEIAARYKAERDEARQELCRVVGYQRQDRFDPKAIAVERGWDCFKKVQP